MTTTHVLCNIIANVKALQQRIERNDYDWDDLTEALLDDVLLLPRSERGTELSTAINTFVQGPELSDAMDGEQIYAWLCEKAEIIRSCADRSLGHI